MALAGGTDLLTELKNSIRTPQKLVNIKIPAQDHDIRFDSEKITISALTTIRKLEEHSQIANQIPILRDAAATVGSP